MAFITSSNHSSWRSSEKRISIISEESLFATQDVRRLKKFSNRLSRQARHPHYHSKKEFFSKHKAMHYDNWRKNDVPVPMRTQKERWARGPPTENSKGFDFPRTIARVVKNVRFVIE